MRLSIVIPCFNEQGSLGELHRRVSAAATHAVGGSYELILVNDGSTDASWELMTALVARDPRCMAIDLSRRYGQQLALTAGLDVCSGDRVLIMDADLQDPPELLGDMMRLMDEGADVVYGERTARPGDGFFKRLSARLFHRLMSFLADGQPHRDVGEFRLLSAPVVRALREMPEHHRFVRAMANWLGFRQVPLRYVRAPRTSGSSGYSFRAMSRLAVDAITGFSIRPLRLAFLPGLLCTLAGVVGALVILRDWLSGRTAAGLAGVVVLVLLLGGVQFLLLGTMGEYLGRLCIEAKRRPLYVVRRIQRQDRAAVEEADAHRDMPARSAVS